MGKASKHADGGMCYSGTGIMFPNITNASKAELQEEKQTKQQ